MTEDTAHLILLVDDDTTHRDAIAARLRRYGYRVECASNGKEGMEAAHTERPDIILSDWEMPVMDGLTFCRQTKADSHLELCHFILFTIRGDDAKIEALEGGADDFLPKPCPPFELDARVRVGVRVVDTLRRLEATNVALIRSKMELERHEAEVEDRNRELIEITSQLHVEKIRREEAEAELIQGAQSKVIIEAARMLSHEINNPLSVISGSTESALRRLRTLQSNGVEEAGQIVRPLERILLGVNRIEDVVQSFSKVVNPVTADYVPGVSMLELRSA